MANLECRSPLLLVPRFFLVGYNRDNKNLKEDVMTGELFGLQWYWWLAIIWLIWWVYKTR